MSAQCEGKIAGRRPRTKEIGKHFPQVTIRTVPGEVIEGW